MASILTGRFSWSRPSHLRYLCRSFASTNRTLSLDAKKVNTPGTKSASADTKKDDSLQPLNRPLGVKQRPTTVERSRTDKLKDLLDQEARMAQRRHLIKEAGKGYFHDLNMTRRHGGKTWIAPRVLIKEDKALYLPNIHGKGLVDGIRKNTTVLLAGKITVLAMLGTRISETHAQSFATITHARYSSNTLFQYVQINLQENLLKSFLVKLFSNTLRSSVPTELHKNYLISNQNLEYLRDSMGMTNSKVGYVYLVDENLKIRWAGCADASEKEAQSLESCTGVLLKRLEEKVGLANAHLNSSGGLMGETVVESASSPQR